MPAGTDDAEHRLGVFYNGAWVTDLQPGCRPFTFGRGKDRRLQIGTERGPRGFYVARAAGSVHWAHGSWFVRNDSEGKPFDVLAAGVAQSVAPAGLDTAAAPVAVGPGGVVVSVPDPVRDDPHVIELVPRWRTELPPPSLPPQDPDDETTEPGEIGRMGLRARRILAVKFLSDAARPGRAVNGNAEVARRVGELEGGTEVGVRAVNMVVWRCRRYLSDLGVRELDPPDALGVRLLHWGVIRQSDRALLRPSRTIGDAGALVRPAVPEDLETVAALLGGLSEADPVVRAATPHLVRRGHGLSALVRRVAETVLPLGASLIAGDSAAALLLPPSPGHTALQALLDDVAHRYGLEVAALCGALAGWKDRVPAYRLCALGVADVDRGQGLGAALVTAATARCDREQAAAVATTVTDGPLYRLCSTHGFASLPGGPDGATGTLRALWREPAAPGRP